MARPPASRHWRTERDYPLDFRGGFWAGHGHEAFTADDLVNGARPAGGAARPSPRTSRPRPAPAADLPGHPSGHAGQPGAAGLGHDAAPCPRRGFHPGGLSPHGGRRAGWRLLRHLHAAGPADAGRHDGGARCRAAAGGGNPRDGGGASGQVRAGLHGGRRARIAAKGKSIVYQSIENSYPLGDDITLLRGFYRLGVRMVGFIHFKNNQFGDSATDTPQWNGLSPKGRELVALANDLGMVLDASHAVRRRCSTR